MGREEQREKQKRERDSERDKKKEKCEKDRQTQRKRNPEDRRGGGLQDPERGQEMRWTSGHRERTGEEVDFRTQREDRRGGGLQDPEDRRDGSSGTLIPQFCFFSAYRYDFILRLAVSFS